MRVLIILSFIFLPLKASLFSDQELVTWLDQARAYDQVDAEYVEQREFEEEAVKAYLTAKRVDVDLSAKDLEEAQKAIWRHSEWGRASKALVLAPWERMLMTFLGAATSPRPTICWPELMGLYIRGVPCAPVLIERLKGIEGLSLNLTALRLQ